MEMKDELLLPLPRALRGWVATRLVWSDEIGSIAVSFQNHKYVVLINPGFYARLSHEDRRAVLFHELLHVRRGDLIRAQAEKLQPVLWNIATDAVINRDLQSNFLNENGVNYENLLSELNCNPNAVLSASELYDLMLKSLPEQTVCSDHNDLLFGDNISAIDHMREVRGLVDAARADGIDELTHTTSHSPRAGCTRGNSTWTAKDHSLHAVAVRIRNTIKKASGNSRMCRSWRRERHEMIASYRAERAVRIYVYLDFSGSTSQCWDLFASIARWLMKSHGARVFVFDVSVKPYADNMEDVGGGTLFAPIAEHVRIHHPSVVIICSDCEFADKITTLDASVMWIVPRGYVNKKLQGDVIEIDSKLGV